MRGYSPGGRAAPMDRNPLSVNLTIDAPVVGGTADTIALTYTVPTARRALILIAVTLTITVAFAVGQLGMVHIWPPNSAGPTLGLIVNDVGGPTWHDKLVVPGVFMTAGFFTQVRYQLSAGAGAMRVTALVNGVEYDA